MSIKNIARIDSIISGSILITANLVEPKREILGQEIHWLFCFKYWGLSIQGGQKEHIFCPCWVYNKTFICKAPYVKASSWQRV